MNELQVTLPIAPHVDALTQAINTALPGKSSGISTYGDASNPISIWFFSPPVLADITTAQASCAAHDPVHLTVDKTTITANGSDMATVTVSATKQGAAAVKLSVSLNSGTPQDFPINLTNGIGSNTITSIDPCNTTV